MESYKERFIEFMVRCGVLTFGDFTTKSGRRTPFFINTGKYQEGQQIQVLGLFYTKVLINNVGFAGRPILFGPAYKGIPLVIATAIYISDIYKVSLPYCFNRKEAKDHGEGGLLIGHKPVAGEKVVIIEDVITAGTSIRETFDLFQTEAPQAEIVGAIISVDRMERGKENISAIHEIHDEFGIPVYPIVNLDEIIAHLHNREIDGRVILDDAIKARIDAYRDQYGVK